MNGLSVGDTVWLDDGFAQTWTDGKVTMIRSGDGTYVRWPDGVVGIFDDHTVKYLKKGTPT
jgi:hypothetical protein